MGAAFLLYEVFNRRIVTNYMHDYVTPHLQTQNPTSDRVYLGSLHASLLRRKLGMVLREISAELCRTAHWRWV